MTRRTTSLLLFGLLAGCADAPPPRASDAAGAVDVQREPSTQAAGSNEPGVLRLRCELDGVEHRAQLRREGAGWRLVSLEPAPGGPLSAGDLSWVFCGLPTHADLYSDGGRFEHPDRARLSDLLARAAGPGAELAPVLDELPLLLRCESRAQLLTRLATREPLPPGQVDLLVNVATGAPGEDLLRPDPSGAGPGGDAPGALAAALAALADRLDLDRARADRIARASVRVGRDGLVLDLLERLIRNGRAGVPALVEAALEALDDPAQRGAMLLLLARKRSDPSEQLELCRAAPRVGAEASERALLLELVARGAPAHAVVEAVRAGLGSPAARRDVLLALAAREQTPVTLRLVADAAGEVGQDGLEQDLLVVLAAHPGSTIPVLAAAERALVSPTARGRVLLALAERREQALGEQAAVLARVHWIGHDGLEGQVLRALARGGAPTDHVLAAVRRALVAPASKAAVLRALLETGTRPRAELDLVARAVPELGQDALEESLLVALAQDGTASTAAVLAATEAALNAFVARARVLEALARRATLSTDDADRVAAAAPRFLDGGRAVTVLVALGSKASPEQLDDAIERLRGPDDRARARAALGRPERE